MKTGPPGWGLGDRLIPCPCQKCIISGQQNKPRIGRISRSRLWIRKRNNEMKFGTWNVRSLLRPAAFKEAMDEMTRYKIDICGFQEVRWTGKGIIHNKHGDFYFSGSTDRRNQGGTGIFVRKSLTHLVKDFTPVNDRICKIRLATKPHKVTIITAHCPTEEKEDDIKDRFFAELERVYDQAPSYDMKVVLGDFNAKVGKESHFWPIIGKHSLHDVSNNNGFRLIEFASSKNLTISSTWFPHKKIHKGTWRSPDGNTTNQIDHVMVDKRYASHILDVVTKRGANVDSDHFLVVVKARIKMSHGKTNMTEDKVVSKWNYENLKFREVRKKFAEIIDERLAKSGKWEQEEDINKLWCDLKNITTEAAQEVLGKAEKIPRNDWFDAECREAIEKKNEVRKRLLISYTRNRLDEYKQIRTFTKRLFRRKKREQMGRNLEEMENARSVNEPRKFYKKLKEIKCEFKPQSKYIRNNEGVLMTDAQAVLQSWVNYYKNEFQEREENKYNNPEEGRTSLRLERAEIDEMQAPDISEVQDAIKALKNNKSPGFDAISSEMIKHSGTTPVKLIHRLMEKVWTNNGHIPHEWKIGIICPIYKKGDPTECRNYRAITLLPTIYKIVTYIVRKRLEGKYEELIGEYQCGFRRNKSTTNQLFTVRQVMEKTWEHNISTYHLFLDFATAYDSITRKEMWIALTEIGLPRKLVCICRSIMENSKAMIKIGNKLSDEFDVEKGVKQGDGLAPILFNLILEAVIRRAGVKRSGTLLSQSYQILGYADDLDIAGRSVKVVKEVFAAIEKEAEKVGLKINEAKTKFMIVSRNQQIFNTVGPSISMENYTFQVVKEFKYLGSILTSNNDETHEIKQRIVSANKAYFSLLPLIKSKDVTKASKCKIYKSLLRPIITYGSECWVLKDADADLIARTERKVLRRMFGAKKISEHEYQRRTNKDLYNIYDDIDIVSFIRCNRLRWLGHVNRMQDSDPCKKLLTGNLQGTRPRGRPRNRWWDAVFADIKTFHIENWAVKSKNREEWRKCLLEVKALARAVVP